MQYQKLNSDSRSKQFSCVIQGECDYKSVFEYLDTLGCQYYFITHDSDYNDNDDLVALHHHLVLEFPQRIRFKQLMNYLIECFNDDDINRYSIRKPASMFGAIQYLVHKNQPHKHQYQDEEIITNVEFTKLSNILNTLVFSDVEVEANFIEIVKESTNIELINILGVYRYNTLRNTIKDIRRELHLD